VQMCKWQLDVHTLNQFIAELKRTSQAAAVSAVIESTAELNSRWNKLTLDANEREVGSVCVSHVFMMLHCSVTEPLTLMDFFPVSNKSKECYKSMHQGQV